ncbi:HesA/MoeB/ThiF family protein [Lewinella sp. 4G2]|uniref:HesA/MoeB/ThiF family protein n=1 Tax=Lewinella sp. 4G2 TaxID=1803372 RepID=UPI0007B4C309|nr:HesA/MoeB/ThiF family protein [Lewinella sp. 4G2]OAV44968.1 hypothetical protein A3850_010895 [Lewinella sp. 4G2]
MASGEKRFVRQTVLPGVGQAGQEKLGKSHVLIVGCGGLGSPAAVYLAGAGVGRLTLVDGDRISLSNLHRQVFYREDDPRYKVEALAEYCRSLHLGTRVSAQKTYLDAGNVKALIEAADIVLDCCDDAATKHLLSDACHTLRTPLVYGAAQGFSGYLCLFPNDVKDAPHLRDLYPEPDPTLPDCATTGVLGTAVATIGLQQATTALTYLIGLPGVPTNTLITYDALTHRQHRLQVPKTYVKDVPPPFRNVTSRRAELETDDFDLSRYTKVFTMLDEQREPEPDEGVIRLTKRNPFGQCVEQMKEDGEYLLYCNSGKLSLMLAAQLQKAGYRALSLRGGLVAFGR